MEERSWSDYPAKYLSKKQIKQPLEIGIYSNVPVGYVIVDSKGIHIFKSDIYPKPSNPFDNYIGSISNYKGIFIPYGIDIYNNLIPEFDGNSLLVKITNTKYIYIGHPEHPEGIYQFETKEPITKYYSVMWNNAVHLPHAETKNYYYVLEFNEGKWYIKKSKVGIVYNLPFHIGHEIPRAVTRMKTINFDKLLKQKKVNDMAIKHLSKTYPAFSDVWSVHGRDFLFHFR